MALVDGLISFWELEEALGSRVDAVVASANDLSDNNVVTSVTGIVGNAAHFLRAASQFLNKASNASLVTGDIDFSFVIWVNQDSLSGSMALLTKGNGTVYEYQLYMSSSIGKYRWYVEGPTTFIDLIGDTITSGWQMIVVWHDSVNNIVGISLNNGTPLTSSYSDGARSTAHNFVMGADNAGVIPFDGGIDQVGFWKKVLDAGEITQLYNAGAGMTYAAIAATGGSDVLMGQVLT